VDAREGILARLTVRMATIPGIASVFRNKEDPSVTSFPAIVVMDDSELEDDATRRDRMEGRGKILKRGGQTIMTMAPQIVIWLGAIPDNIGTELNSFRAAVIKAIYDDDQLAALVGTNGDIRYEGCTTHLAWGTKETTGVMILKFTFAYYLLPSEL
jgi:hypothetical protein